MKKIVSLVLVVLFSLSVFALVGCGNINESDVVILWKDEDVAVNPNSLINSMDRAMYIEKIGYKHVGAKGDADLQVQQAKEAIDAGCAALVVELISSLKAKEIVDYAKNKNVPVIFINTPDPILEGVVADYDKCAVVGADLATVSEIQGELIADYIKANFKKLDKNQDGKITYLASDLGLISKDAAKKANELLATKDYVVKGEDKKEINTSVEAADVSFADLLAIDLTAYELILTADDLTAFEVLKTLQKKDYNTNKLTTHFVPVITVGDSMDYKSYVIAGRPEIPEELKISETDSSQVIKQKNKKIKKLEELKTYYEKNQYLVDLTIVDESELGEMIYTTRNVVGTGRLAGSVLADDDAIAGAVAQIVSNLIKGKDMFDIVASKVKEGEAASVVVDGKIVKVRYISLTE